MQCFSLRNLIFIIIFNLKFIFEPAKIIKTVVYLQHIGYKCIMVETMYDMMDVFIRHLKIYILSPWRAFTLSLLCFGEELSLSQNLIHKTFISRKLRSFSQFKLSIFELKLNETFLRLFSKPKNLDIFMCFFLLFL